MAELGITGVSRLYEHGLDAIIQNEYSKAIDRNVAYSSQLEVYAADIHQVNKSRLPRRKLAKIRNPSLVEQTEKIAAKYHSNWENCSSYSRKLLGRNVHIIFGYH